MTTLTDLLPTLFFYLFAGITVFSAVMVVASKNPVHSVFFLILAFFNSAALFLLASADRWLALPIVLWFCGYVLMLRILVPRMPDTEVSAPLDPAQDKVYESSVDALIKVLETSADEQDFFLNQEAAKALGALGNPKAVPALIRGLFMVGRGANIYQPCRVSLLQLGKPAIQPLIGMKTARLSK